MSLSQARLSDLRTKVSELLPRESFALQRDGALLVDIREPDELSAGSPEGSFRLVRGFLELQIESVAPDHNQTILLMCAGGTRSLFAAHDLQSLGYRDVRSVSGGFAAWQREGLPTEIPRTLSDDAKERYSRHLMIPEVGVEGQLKLQASRVLIVGAGGLGSPAALYLAAAGVGTLGLIDDDVVDRSNLQRQLLHRDQNVGQAKTSSAKKSLLGINPAIEVVEHRHRLEAANVDQILGQYDLIVDGCDNFSTRYLINDACLNLDLTCVHGSIFRFEGQVSVFRSYPVAETPEPGPCYRCLFPEPPPPELAPSCAEAGVLGVLPGVIGCLQAVEAIKLLLGLGTPLVGRLLTYDALDQRFTELAITRDPSCDYCNRNRPQRIEYADSSVATCAIA